MSGPPLVNQANIPGSSIFNTEYSIITKSEYLEIGKNEASGATGIVIENGGITNLGQPIELSDLSNKEYVDNTLNFTQVNAQTNISSQFDVTYTADQLIYSIINRNPNGDARFDSFDTVANVLIALGTYNTPGTSFTIVITNTPTLDTDPLTNIILNYNDFNVIGITSNIIIFPGSTAIFNCVVVDTGIDAYYSNTINKGIANSFSINNLGFSLDTPLRSFQLLPAVISLFNYEIFSNDIPLVQNCLFTVLGDYNVQTTGSYNITGELPTATQVMETLGVTAETLEEGTSFNFIVRLIAYLPHLPLLYTYQMTTDGSIDIDPNSIGFSTALEFSELAWKYAEYSIVANPIGSLNLFTIYCVSYYDTFTAN